MRSIILAASIFFLSVSCKHGTFAQPETNVSAASRIDKNSINIRAYNAFQMWQGTMATAWAELPSNFWNFKQVSDKTPDRVFYVAGEDFFLGGDFKSWSNFSAEPTPGITIVNNDTLVYPTYGGKNLSIRFLPESPNAMTLEDAVEYCDEKGRLPTARELFDFCAAGVTEPNYGKGFKLNQYPKKGRCSNLWSISLFNLAREDAWKFNSLGYMKPTGRSYNSGVRCVDASAYPRIFREYQGGD
jgi:hypothetical protein